MNPEFEEKLKTYLSSMIEVVFEYVGNNKEEVDEIYIFCSTEESLFFQFFYSINGQIVKKHKVNDLLILKCDTSKERQFSVLDIGMEDLSGIVSLFNGSQKDVPKSIKISYKPLTKEMDTHFIYDNRLIGTDLMEENLVEDWISLLI